MNVAGAPPQARNARRVLVALAAITAFSPSVGFAATAYTTPPPSSAPARASLPAIERRVMCVTCKIPLIVAESPQADRERVFIRGLIAEGKTEPEIESALVSQYGPTALGLPSAHGFDLTAYLVPLAAVLALLATFALLLPRWRRRTRAAPDSPSVPALGAAERARLDADLARFDG
ncbi:MAG TPA: cytochrome c-type biogenesis protein CcmH [Solirubrobacteraceae bacterium]|jgi:cytochrome c-type biogenesis protein CcmH